MTLEHERDSYHANEGEAKEMERALRVGAAQMEWEVSFRCPECGEVIFPEDTAGRYYSLLEVKIEEREIREAVIRCVKCGSLVCLESFDLLNRLGCSNESGDVEGQSIDRTTRR